MSVLEGIEQPLTFRAILASAVQVGGASEGASRQLLPVVAVTDCKSVYDSVPGAVGEAPHDRLGGPSSVDP